jgi:hypothetical protein
VDVLWQEFTAGFRDWPQFARVALRLIVAIGSALLVLIPAQAEAEVRWRTSRA